MVETTYMGILCGILAGLIIVGFIGCGINRKRENSERDK